MKMLRHWWQAQCHAHPGLARIALNTGWLLADHGVRLGLGFIVMAWMARALGPVSFAQISYVLSLYTLYLGVARCVGLENLAIHEFVKRPYEHGMLVGTMVHGRLMFGFVCAALLVLTVALLRQEDTDAFFMALALLPAIVLQGYEALDWWFAAHVRSKYVVIAKSAGLALACILRIILILLEAPLWLLAASFGAEIVFAVVGRWWFYRQQPDRPVQWGDYPEERRQLLVHGAPLFWQGVLLLVYSRIDMVMVAHMLDDHQTGYFAAATRISEAFFYVPLALVSSVMPGLMRLRLTNPPLYAQRLSWLYHALAFVALGGAAFLSLLSPWIIRVVYGEAFAPAAPILAVHVWAGVFLCFGLTQGQWLIAGGKKYIRFGLWRGLFGIGLNIVFNAIAIPRYGAVGAVTGTVLSQAVSGVISNLFFDAATRRVFTLQARALLLLDGWGYLWRKIRER